MAGSESLERKRACFAGVSGSGFGLHPLLQLELLWNQSFGWRSGFSWCNASSFLPGFRLCAALRGPLRPRCGRRENPLSVTCIRVGRSHCPGLQLVESGLLCATGALAPRSCMVCEEADVSAATRSLSLPAYVELRELCLEGGRGRFRGRICRRHREEERGSRFRCVSRNLRIAP